MDITSLDHLFTFDGHGTMTAREWLRRGGTDHDFGRDEVEHSSACWCHTPQDGNPPF